MNTPAQHLAPARLGPIPAGAHVLVTGIAGFSGRHMARLLAAESLEVAGLLREQPGRDLADLPPARLVYGDLRDRAGIARLIAELRPQAIFHLAALTRSPDLGELIAQNVLATDNLLAAAVALQEAQGEPVRVLIAGSAAEYGPPPAGVDALREDAPPRPASPYGVSKLAQVALGLSRWASDGLPVYTGRLFNCLGPGEPPTLAASALARQVAAIALGMQEPLIRAGNLAAERDFLDIRDVVRAYWAIMCAGRAGAIYNVCSGRPTPIGWLLSELCDIAGVRPQVRQEPGLARRADIARSVGDGGLLRAETGWSPQIDLRRSLADLLADWKHRLAHDRTVEETAL